MKNLIFASTLLAGVSAALVATHAQKLSAPEFTAHEWGTFTSVQGSDGGLLIWRPLETSQLPGFVYNWSHPGFGRVAAPMVAGGKGAMITLQRLETPVIYFYSDQDLKVDVDVRFPHGYITEWYPQANRIGPTIIKASATAAKSANNQQLKDAASQTVLSAYSAKDSRIEWSNLDILPARANSEISATLPSDKSGNHYFTARATDSAFVRTDIPSPSGKVSEHEKYLFYRGVGNFVTPLRISMPSADTLNLTNTGTDALPHLFVLQLHQGQGQLTQLDKLAAGASQSVQLNSENLPKSKLTRQVAAAMRDALTSQGLYPREAQAMVNTWKDSWFAEDGVRVLYILPRAWTDQTLPLEVKPRPRQLVRVMVGRAEIITPQVESQLQRQLARAKAGDTQVRDQIVAELKKLGRFAEPAIRRVTGSVKDPAVSQLGWTLLQDASKPTVASAH